MLRTPGTLLALLVLLAPAALAATEPEAPVEAPGADAAPLRALERAGDAVAGGAAKVGAGAAGAASAVGDGLAALGSAIASGALALVDGLGVALSLAGSALAALGRGLAALGRGALDLAVALGGLLATLVGNGAAFARAHPVATGATAAGGAALGGLLWLLRRLGGLAFLAPLYTRLRPGTLLENEARHAVYDHVRSHPGAHPSAIAEALGLGWGTVVYHLAKLESSQMVTSRAAHNRKCYFALTADLDAQARTAVAAMSTDKTRSIVEAVRASPGISQKELSERLGISQALASWHVKRLVESGVLVTQREGRSNALRVAAHVPGAVPVAA